MEKNKIKIFNRKALKVEFVKRGVKIGSVAIEKFILEVSGAVNLEIEKKVRETIILGKKVVS